MSHPADPSSLFSLVLHLPSLCLSIHGAEVLRVHPGTRKKKKDLQEIRHKDEIALEQTVNHM